MKRDEIMTSIVIPKYQDEYCKEMNISKKDAYINAFNKVYFGDGPEKLRKIKRLAEERERLEMEVFKAKNKSLNAEEMKYLKESLGAINGTKSQISVRFKSFQRVFKRYYHDIEEFERLVRQINNIK